VFCSWTLKQSCFQCIMNRSYSMSVYQLHRLYHVEDYIMLNGTDFLCCCQWFWLCTFVSELCAAMLSSEIILWVWVKWLLKLGCIRPLCLSLSQMADSGVMSSGPCIPFINKGFLFPLTCEQHCDNHIALYREGQLYILYIYTVYIYLPENNLSAIVNSNNQCVVVQQPALRNTFSQLCYGWCQYPLLKQRPCVILNANQTMDYMGLIQI
jgi:hypothetical protein